MRFEDLKIIKLIENADLKTVANQYLQISSKTLYARISRLRIKYVKTRLWLNFYEAQRKKRRMVRILTPTEREREIANLEYEERMEELELL